MRLIGILLALELAGHSSLVVAQPVAIRALGPVVATSPVPFRNVTQVVSLNDGRVMVNDYGRKQVLLLDGNLANPGVAIDSVAGRDNSYGTSGGTLLTFLGDSVLMYNSTAKVFLVLDSRGTVARVMAPPFTEGGPLSGSVQTIAFSPALGLVYGMGVSPTVSCPLVGPVPPVGEPDLTLKCDDSAVVVRANVTTRKADTLSRLSSGALITRLIRAGGPPTGSSSSRTTTLFPFIDAFTVTRDGSIAILRSRDYRLDWVNADGTRSVSARLPYDWRRFSDDERQHLVDSINADRIKADEDRLAKWLKDSTAVGGKGPTTTATVTYATGEVKEVQMASPHPQPSKKIDPQLIPDFLPPTARDAITADAENNVWIHPIARATSASTEGQVYDVVNRQGVLIDRVRIPAGRTIAGFAPGFVFLLAHDGGAITLEKARLR